jgi:hypothetical protein
MLADHGTQRTGSVYERSHPDQPDQATSVPHSRFTAPACKSTEPVSGWRRSMARGRAGNGESWHLAVGAASGMIVAQTLTDRTCLG